MIQCYLEVMLDVDYSVDEDGVVIESVMLRRTIDGHEMTIDLIDHLCDAEIATLREQCEEQEVINYERRRSMMDDAADTRRQLILDEKHA